MNLFEAVIGLEVHAQLMTQTKAFCFVSNSFGDEPNSQVGPVSGGLPGALPVLNEKAVELAVRAGLALGCKINKKSIFSRKNYFYPDLPKGYQISQFDEPICLGGGLEIALEDKPKRVIHLERIHMEEDAGKLVHMASATLVNLNRAGVPLIEIVTKPEIKSPAEAVAYLKRLHAILVYAEICDGNLEEGNFRCDANVSVRRVGETKLGTRTELKNINSFRFIEKAIEFEIARQIAVVDSGGIIVQETRGWDSGANKTYTMRTKEDAHDYRYFPDPDLPPLVLDPSFIEAIRKAMPELPQAKKERFVKEYNLSEYDAESVTATRDLATYFEVMVASGAAPKMAANWIATELLRELKETEAPLSACPIGPKDFAELLILIDKGTISGKIAKSVFSEMYKTRKTAGDIVKEKGLVQVLDTSAIDAWVDVVIAANPMQAAEYKSGKIKLMGFFVGEVMKLSKGKANPPLVTASVQKKLGA